MTQFLEICNPLCASLLASPAGFHPLGLVAVSHSAAAADKIESKLKLQRGTRPVEVI